MKNFASLILVAMITSSCFIYFSCRKEANIPQENQSIQLQTVSVLKEWMIKKKENLSLTGKATIDSIMINAQWEQGVYRTASNGKQLIYIPTTNRIVGLEFFYDNTEKVIDSCNIVKITNSRLIDRSAPILAIETYYETKVLKRQSATNYSGTIFAYSIENKFLYDYSFNQGKIYSKGFLAPASKSENVKSIKTNSVGINMMGCEIWGHFTEWESGLVTLDYTYLVCYCDVTTSIEIRTGQHRIKSNCVGGDPNGGTPEPAGPVVRLWNNLHNPCLKKLLDRVMSNVNSLTTTLAQTYAPGSHYAFNYMESQILADNVMGGTQPTMSGTDALYWANIHLNSNKLPISSQELSAVVMMHEALHGFINATQGLTPSLYDHNFMAEGLAYDISSALKQLFPNIDPVHAYALGWTGLNDDAIAGWRALPPNSKWFFNQIINSYTYLGSAGTRVTSCP